MVRVRVALSRGGTITRLERRGKTKVTGRIDPECVDRTSEADILRQEEQDDRQARRDAAAYARRVRRRTP